MKLRIHGDIETPYGIAETTPYPPFFYPTHTCVMHENESGEEYPKYVEFDFEINVENLGEAVILKSFIESFGGTSDGSFEVDIIVDHHDPELMSEIGLSDYEKYYPKAYKEYMDSFN